MTKLKQFILFAMACIGCPLLLVGVAGYLLAAPFLYALENTGRNKPDGTHT